MNKFCFTFDCNTQTIKEGTANFLIRVKVFHALLLNISLFLTMISHFKYLVQIKGDCGQFYVLTNADLVVKVDQSQFSREIMNGLRELKKKQTRQSIITAAVKLFSQKGYENTSVEELAREAGIAKGTIYSYFKTKSEIFLAFCEDEIDFVFNELSSKCDPNTDLLTQLHTLFMGQFRYVTKNNEFGRIFAREMTFPKEVSRDMSQGIEKRYLSALGNILNNAINKGELRGDLEFIFITGHFYALYLVVLSSWYEGRFTTEKEISEALMKLLKQAMEGLAEKPTNK